MESKTNDPLVHMTETERTCVQSYIDLLAQRLADSLVAVWLFGSFARGDMWGRHWPMNSDVDLLILTEQPISDQDREELIKETSPSYLECGRQISPQFRTVREFQSPATERGIAFDGKGKLTVTITVNLPDSTGGRTVTALTGTGTYTVEEAGTRTALIQFDGLAETPFGFVITQSEKLKKLDQHRVKGKAPLLLATEVFAVSQSGGLNGQLVAPTWTKRSD